MASLFIVKIARLAETPCVPDSLTREQPAELPREGVQFPVAFLLAGHIALVIMPMATRGMVNR